MENKEGYLEFIFSENYKHQIDVWYRAYNITHEKTTLFYDFLISLCDIVDNTHLGIDVIKTEEEELGHFTWCWEKTIDNFSKERIYFKDNGRHKDYFYNFYKETYYIPKILNEHIKIKEYFNKLFDFKHKKSRSELDMLTEVYKLLEQNLKK